MGKRGTQVAQEAADVVLIDDAFASIVAAVRQGRVIFSNIRKFVIYLMSCNVSEIMIVAGAVAVNAPLPLLPLQILFLNLVTDVFPALALAMGEGSPSVMDRPPRDPSEPVLAGRHWRSIVGIASVITAAVLSAPALERLQRSGRRLELVGQRHRAEPVGMERARPVHPADPGSRPGPGSLHRPGDHRPRAGRLAARVRREPGAGPDRAGRPGAPRTVTLVDCKPDGLRDATIPADPVLVTRLAR